MSYNDAITVFFPKLQSFPALDVFLALIGSEVQREHTGEFGD